MRQLMSELSKAPKVSQNLIDMTNALAKLARTGASSGRAANALGIGLNTYTKSTHKASRGPKDLHRHLERCTQHIGYYSGLLGK